MLLPPSPRPTDIGCHLLAARQRLGWTQQDLAAASGIDRFAIGRLERGERWPTVPQMLSLAWALNVPLQWFLTGERSPGTGYAETLLELRDLGITDLHAEGAVVPGAFRPPEEVIALALRGDRPDPRVVEAVPAVLAWRTWRVELLITFAREVDPRVPRRLAWLADVALTMKPSLDFRAEYPGELDLSELIRRTPVPAEADSLGRPAAGTLSPVWRRWGVTYDAGLQAFIDRAKQLHTLTIQRVRRRLKNR